MTGTIVEKLAEYGVAERARVLPAEVRHHARRALIDWFASLLPGSIVDPAQAMIKGLADELGHGRAFVYGSGKFGSLRAAALINGTASHTIEFDDIFRDAIYHPGCPTISAALAAAQAKGSSAAELLTAIIVGYEISTRIGLSVQPSHYKYWHTTGTIGTYGAAAAVATILKLDREKFAHALATSATMAAALQQAFRSDSMSKPLHAGHAAEAGAMAALSAEYGMTGALDVLEGEAGFGAAMSTTVDWSKATAGLGAHYNITQMTFKNHGCCGHAFPAIDGVLHLKAAHGFAPEAIKRIRVGGYRATLEVAGVPKATTPFEGRFSTPFLVASALVHGSVRLNAYEPERLADARVQALSDKVELKLDEQCAADFPKRRSARVAIDLADGRTARALPADAQRRPRRATHRRRRVGQVPRACRPRPRRRRRQAPARGAVGRRSAAGVLRRSRRRAAQSWLREADMRLKDKVAIITGGAAGMGAATARLFAREGAKIVITDIDEKDGPAVAADIVRANGDARFEKHDVAKEADWQRIVDAALAAYGRIDILINNAGISGSIPDRLDLDMWDRQILDQRARDVSRHPRRRADHAEAEIRIDREHFIDQRSRRAGLRAHGLQRRQGRGPHHDQGRRCTVRAGEHPHQFRPSRHHAADADVEADRRSRRAREDDPRGADAP